MAFLSPAWPPDAAANGIVTYVDQIVAGLRRMGHQPCILSATGNGQWPGVYFLDQESASPSVAAPQCLRLSRQCTAGDASVAR